jgi:hypothetical protein
MGGCWDFMHSEAFGLGYSGFEKVGMIGLGTRQDHVHLGLDMWTMECHSSSNRAHLIYSSS